jgi:ABC-2 type transport system permease protein
MLGASVYIIVCSARNRLRTRLRRLREPRYLVGAIVGIAYLYFSIFARMGRRGGSTGRRGSPPAAMLAALRTGAPGAVGLALLAATVIGWILPFSSGLLDFSQSEVQFLFPAPVSRRSLLVHRMLRSQIGILIGSIIPALMVQSFSGYARLRLSVATWLILSTAKVYATGVSLARTRLTSSDTRARGVAWLPLAVLGSACAIVAIALLRSFSAAPPDGAQDAIVRIGSVVSHGLPLIVLWPFVALAAPLFASWPGAYLVAMLEAALVASACVAWVLASDATFQDAAEEVVARKAQELGQRAVRYRPRATRWALAPTGRPEVAFAWKAAMQTLRVVDVRSFVRLAAILVAIAVGSMAFDRARGLAAVVGAFALAGVGFAVLMAPQILRVDLRQDMKHLELLKTWPVKASAVVRGEIAWPGALLTALAWILIGIALVLSTASFPRVAVAVRFGVAGAAALLAPALVFAQLTIHNGVALMFPAWVPLGSQRARGLDAMGQRLIILGGTWLLLIIMTLPGALASAIVWFAFRTILGPLALLPGAVICAVIVGIEVLAATEVLGPLYERMDVLSVERTE